MTSSWFSNSSTITMMHGPINIRYWVLLRKIYIQIKVQKVRCQQIYLKLQTSALWSLVSNQQNLSCIALRIVNGFHFKVKLTRSAWKYCSIKMRQIARSYCCIISIWLSKLIIRIRWLTLNPLKWKIWWAPKNASRWQMGFNSAFERLKLYLKIFIYYYLI